MWRRETADDQIVNYLHSSALQPSLGQGEVREVPEFVLSGSVQELGVSPRQQAGSLCDQLPGEAPP